MLSVEDLFCHISTTHLRWHALPSLQQKRSRRERPYNRPTFTESFNFTDEHVDIVSEEFDGLFHDVVGENLSFLEQDDYVSQEHISQCCVEQPIFLGSCSFETFAEADAHEKQCMQSNTAACCAADSSNWAISPY